MKKSIMEKYSVRRLSSLIRNGLIALAGVVFVLFWLIGFDRPFEDEPNFNDPLLTNVVLVLMMLMVVAAVAIVVWSVVRNLKSTGRKERMMNNIPVRRIAVVICVGTLVVMLLTFAFGSSKPMLINGSVFADVFWLKATNMMIATSLILMVAAVAAVVMGTIKWKHKP